MTRLSDDDLERIERKAKDYEKSLERWPNEVSRANYLPLDVTLALVAEVREARDVEFLRTYSITIEDRTGQPGAPVIVTVDGFAGERLVGPGDRRLMMNAAREIVAENCAPRPDDA